MISVTPFEQSSEFTAQRTRIIRTAAIAAVALSLFALAIFKLANVTGDMLSASVLACAGLATIVAVLSPKSGVHSHG
jgi:hypothetical protein